MITCALLAECGPAGMTCAIDMAEHAWPIRSRAMADYAVIIGRSRCSSPHPNGEDRQPRILTGDTLRA